MVRKMLLGAVMIVALFAAPAAAQYPSGITPPQVLPGGGVNVFGGGCSPGAEVTITVSEPIADRAPGDVIVTTTTTADEDGNFNTTIIIPEGTPPGVYTVTATCDGAVVLNGSITVLGDDVTPTTTPGTPGGGTIVRTGSDLNGLGIAGAAMLGVGGAILLATRSRRHRAA